MAETMDGQCRCGDTVMRVAGAPMITMACHCVGCQRMSSSAYSLSAAFASEGFSVVRGQPVVGGLRGATRHYFCGACMTWMFTRPEGMDWLVNVRPTMLDGQRYSEPFIETWAKEKLPWATTTAKHSFDTVPAVEQYEPLVAEYQKTLPGS